ncbi:hypothetical protein [Marinoscillum sp.]|uniref:hypothetical protein n=1 Tax=Marinoscillum sp. TaxID=2024838 RepID=UPI003BA9591E
MKRAIICLVWLTGISCSDEINELELDPGYDFYPLEIGQYHLYQVQEITYEVFEPDTATYYLREVVSDSLVSGDGSVKYLINRYKGEDSTALTLDSIWAVRKTDRSVIRSENNRDYVKLVFPVEDNTSWDGNAYNTSEEQLYTFQQDDNYELNGEVFDTDHTIRVIIADVERNLVSQDERSEVYLRNVGLALKNYVQLSFCTVNCEGKGSEVGEIEKGKILLQELIRYGKE